MAINPPNGSRIDLAKAQELIKNYLDLMQGFADLAGPHPSTNAGKFVKQLAEQNAYVIDSHVFKKLKDADYCIVFFASEGTGFTPTLVIANCDTDEKYAKFMVPDKNIAALEHIPPLKILTLEKANAAAPAMLTFSPQ